MKKIIFLSLIFNMISVLFSKQIIIKDKDLDIGLEKVKITNITTGEIFYTDIDGKLEIQESTKNEQMVLFISYPGYESKKVLINNTEEKIVVYLSISNVIQGKELIIEGKKHSESKSQVGKTVTIEKEELKTIAQSGIVEDVMASIKSLPGVSFTSRFDKNFSIRGGEPDGLTSSMDGYVVRHFWHWGGAISIFNPNIVDILSFSSGIFSPKFGPASSGLLDVSVIDPNDGFKIRYSTALDTVEILTQIPLYKDKIGLLINGRITITDIPILISKEMIKQQGVDFTRSPYIYSVFSKLYVKPDDRFEWNLSGFFSLDGIGIIAISQNTNKIENTFDFYWENLITFGNTNFKILPNDKILLKFNVGFDFFQYTVQGKFINKGTKNYSQEFINTFGFILGGKTSYTINQEGNFNEKNNEYCIQPRFDLSYLITQKIEFETGVGGIFQNNLWQSSGEMTQIYFEGNTPKYGSLKIDLKPEDNWILQSFYYANFNFNIINEVLKIETGIRVDHTALVNNQKSINTYPVLGPRFNIYISPFKRNNIFEKLTFSLGVGIFSKSPEILFVYRKDFNLNDFDVSITKVLTTVAGFEFLFPFDIKFKTEGYFKYQFDKFYLNAINSSGNTNIKFHSDGYGFVGGVDVLIERKISRWLDGSISYSFNYSKFIYPQTDGVEFSNDGEPLGKWFFPKYHRFHQFGILLNIRPTNFITITTRWRLATGVPTNTFGEKQMFYAIDNKTGDIIELYTRKNFYSDEKRTDISIPFDLKISGNFVIPKTRVSMEFYVGVEDMFSPIYTPKRGTMTDQFSGDDIVAPESAFALNFPMPSVGFTISF